MAFSAALTETSSLPHHHTPTRNPSVPAAAAKAVKAAEAVKAVDAAKAPEDLRFPIGRFQRPTGPLKPGDRTKYINAIAATPKNMIKAVRGFTGKHFDTPYRPG